MNLYREPKPAQGCRAGLCSDFWPAFTASVALLHWDLPLDGQTICLTIYLPSWWNALSHSAFSSLKTGSIHGNCLWQLTYATSIWHIYQYFVILTPVAFIYLDMLVSLEVWSLKKIISSYFPILSGLMQAAHSEVAHEVILEIIIVILTEQLPSDKASQTTKTSQRKLYIPLLLCFRDFCNFVILLIILKPYFSCHSSGKALKNKNVLYAGSKKWGNRGKPHPTVNGTNEDSEWWHSKGRCEGAQGVDVDPVLWGFISSELFKNMTDSLYFHIAKWDISWLICGKETQESKKEMLPVSVS